MRVETLPSAEKEIRKTARHIQQEFDRKSRDKFIQRVNETKKLLATNPYLGPVEPLLKERTRTYRSVVVGKLNKMIYHIIDDHIEVVALWDCRREPTTLADEVK